MLLDALENFFDQIVGFGTLRLPIPFASRETTAEAASGGVRAVTTDYWSA